MHQEIEEFDGAPDGYERLNEVCSAAAQAIIENMGEDFGGLAVVVISKGERKYTFMHQDQGGLLPCVLRAMTGAVEDELGIGHEKH